MILQQAKDKTFKEKYDDFYKKGGCIEFVVFENFEGSDAYFKHLKNPKYAQTIRSKVASYWDCYYKWEYLKLKDYPAYKLTNVAPTKPSLPQ